MPLACLLIPHFSLRLAVLDQPDQPAGLPLVLTSPSMSRPFVADASPEAVERGLRIGMPLREVNAVCAQAVFIPANPVRDALRFRANPGPVGDGQPGPGAGRAGSLLRRYHRTRPPLPVARSDRRGPAGLRLADPAAARRTRSTRSRPGSRPRWMASPGTMRTIASGELSATLGPLPVSWLPLEPNALLKLDRLGLRTLAELRDLPASSLQARFGPAGREAHACASGQDEGRVYPRKLVESVREEFRLPAPMASREMLLLAIRQLVIRAFNRPALKHRQIRRFPDPDRDRGRQSWERNDLPRADRQPAADRGPAQPVAGD